ncbi:MAG: hypothetical protein KAJ91_02120 [Candidatus Aenigmarchaeota archaeon]|nr:hypothetical protein [Candidatus Aenigmarchaeota archaeon]MCK5334141.1 hypothetical protein [Candidatus Aenigmarchaeota archaeon]
MQPVMKQAQQNIMKSRMPPIFADEAVIITPIRAMKDKDGKITKEGHVVVVFVDMTTQQPVSKIAMTMTTAKNLERALANSIGRLEKDLKSKNIPTKPIEKTETSTKYIG